MISIEEQLTAELHDRSRLAEGVTPDRTDVQRRSERVRRQRQRRRIAGAALAASVLVATAATTMIVRDDSPETVRSDPPAYGFVLDPSAGWTLSDVRDDAPESGEPGEQRPWGVSVRARDGGFGVRSALVIWPSGEPAEAPTGTLGGEQVYLVSGPKTQVIWTEVGEAVMVRAHGLDDTELGAIVAAVSVSSPDAPPDVELPPDSGLTVAPAEQFGTSNLRSTSYWRDDGATVTLFAMDSSLGVEIDAFEGGADDFEIVSLADGGTATLWGDPGVRHLTIEDDDGPSITLISTGLDDEELLALVPSLMAVDQQHWATVLETPTSPPPAADIELRWGECGDGVIGIVYANGSCTTVDGASPNAYLGVAQVSETRALYLFKVDDEVIANTATATLDGDPLPVLVVAGDGPGFAVFGVEVPRGSADTELSVATVVDGVVTPLQFDLEQGG